MVDNTMLMNSKHSFLIHFMKILTSLVYLLIHTSFLIKKLIVCDTIQGQRKGFEQNYKGGSMILAEGADFERKNKGFANSPIQAIFYVCLFSITNT